MPQDNMSGLKSGNFVKNRFIDKKDYSQVLWGSMFTSTRSCGWLEGSEYIRGINFSAAN